MSRGLTPHSGRRAFLRALSLLPFSMHAAAGPARARGVDAFQTGWNHPWIAYGHDFGRAWGHDGLSTNGWTCETEPSTRGFVESSVLVDAESGRGALRVEASLLPGDASMSRGAVYLSLIDHWPLSCPQPGEIALNLQGALARCRIRLPRGSAAGGSSWLQLFLKTRLSAERWPTLYTQQVRISSSWEGTYVDIVVPLDGRNAAHVDEGFEIRSVSLIGLAMGVDSGAAAAISGDIWIDEMVLETAPPVIFDFDQSELGEQVGYVRRRMGRAWSLVRFFTLCDGRAAPLFAPDGSVTGLDEVFYRDFDVLVDTAARQGVSLIPVLLDFGWCAYPRIVSGVRLGGHSDVIRDPEKRRGFLELALKPLLKRYGRHPGIYAWDVCNEPEWVIDENPDAFRRNHDVVSLADMREFVRSCAAYVHRLTPTQLVTLGSARRKWLPLWTGCDLDLYQFHWYDHFLREEPFPWAHYDELGLDRPCFIGEVPTENTLFTRQQFITAAEDAGYSGLLFWSYGARDSASNFCPALGDDNAPRRGPKRA